MFRKSLVVALLSAFAITGVPAASFAKTATTSVKSTEKNVSEETVEIAGEKVVFTRTINGDFTEIKYTLDDGEHVVTYNQKTKELIIDGEKISNYVTFDSSSKNDKKGIIVFGDPDETQWIYVGKDKGDNKLSKGTAAAAFAAIAAATKAPVILVATVLSYYVGTVDTVYYTTWIYSDPNDPLKAMYFTEAFDNSKRREMDKIGQWTTYYDGNELIGYD